MLECRHEARLGRFHRVKDVDADAKRVEQAGGKLHCAPQDIPGVGRGPRWKIRRALLSCCSRALWSMPRPVRRWAHLASWAGMSFSANDEKTAWAFYSSIFGWNQDSTMDMGPMGTYRIFNNGGARSAP